MDTVKLNVIAVKVLSKFNRNTSKEILQTLLLWVSYSGFEITASLLKARNKLIEIQHFIKDVMFQSANSWQRNIDVFFQKMLSCLKIIACSAIHFNNINNSSNSFANHFLVLFVSDVLKCWKTLCAIIHPVYFVYCAIIPGAIDVHVATVSKQDGKHSVEVYAVGFVPSYLLQDAWLI